MGGGALGRLQPGAARLAAVFAVGAVAGWLAHAASSQRAPTQGAAHSAPLTTLGRPKARGEKGWVLSVGLRFADDGSLREAAEAWKRIARYCYEHEPYLWHYEMLRSDKDPLQIVVYERYASKADYLSQHKQSAAFAEFRPVLKRLQDAGKVTVTGGAFEELGYGFT
eukprot:TRINITY_DN62169_c0_g1_i1.p1 TRINITY_DN62169_c0_g1~~TRINITY_DN62169_c0_g1_i1.p1  ORF type:complete len:196 (+),score=68.45 TRINITY_DN62169_c0_g1_i1:88-588(+)